MFFSGKRIVKLDRYIRRADLEKSQFIYHVGDNEEAMYQEVGLPANAAIGDSILPKIKGTVTDFNAEGKWITHKDRPKEQRVVEQRIWRWKEFRGRYDFREQERIVDQPRWCFPRTFVEPPSLETSVQVVQGKRRLVTALPEKSSVELIIHAVNLYLELFGQCHLTDQPHEVPIVLPRRVNWRMLPAGVKPWDRAEHAVREKTGSLSQDSQFIITERQRFICEYSPDDVYVGEGGFSDYLAYVFSGKNLAVLESVTRGNAIYVFDQDWKELSQLTKREILSEGRHKARIIHATGWQERLNQILR